ncbi:MAG: hypothetical protein ABW321_27565 [Polyangiales bacterium]
MTASIDAGEISDAGGWPPDASPAKPGLGMDARAPAPDEDAGDADGGALREPARALAAPGCKDQDTWLLAEDLTPGEPVDYLADRDDQLTPFTISETGTACGTAEDPETCRNDLMLTTSFGRHIVTTRGDEVRYWMAHTVFQLLQPIDSPADAVWLLVSLGYQVPCNAGFQREDDTIVIDNVTHLGNRCLGTLLPDGGPYRPTPFTVRVALDGTIRHPPESDTICSAF